MKPAIKGAFDAGIVEPSHRRRVQEGGHRPGINLAVVIEGAVQGYQHVFIAPIVAYAIDEATSRDICALKWRQIDLAAIFDEDALTLGVPTRTGNVDPVLHLRSPIALLNNERRTLVTLRTP